MNYKPIYINSKKELLNVFLLFSHESRFLFLYFYNRSRILSDF